LGDVIGALPKSLKQDATTETRVILPYYKKIAEKYGVQAEDVFGHLSTLVGVISMLALKNRI
jgi:glycogen synthase